MSKPQVAPRIPYEWKEQIDQLCREKGKSASEVVSEAIALYLGKTSIDSVQSLSKRVGALERQYQKLVKLLWMRAILLHSAASYAK